MIEKAPEYPLKKYKQHFSEEQRKIWENQEVFSKIEREYLYWDKVKYLKFKNWTADEAWFETKFRRSLEGLKYFFLTPIMFEYNSNKALQQRLHYLDFNFGAGIQKEQLLSDLDKQQYLKNALMEESIFSSMIEGATTTRVKAKEMLRKKKKPRTKSEQMILNNFEAIQYISEHKNESISMERMFEIHTIVTKNTLNDVHVGVLRTTNDVHIKNEITGEIVHTPPKSATLVGLMDSFCDFFNENTKEKFIHPIVKASILHFLIGYIHPFYDGNGRTARAIFYWYLLQNGYWLTEYLSISRVIMQTKTQYEKAYLYTEIDDMDVTYFIHYQVKVLTKAFEDLKKYMSKKKKQQKDLTKFLQLSKINERQAQILFWLEKDATRSFTVKEIENIFSITNQTARTDLEDLVDEGFLKKIALDKKTSNYWKGEDFDFLIT